MAEKIITLTVTIKKNYYFTPSEIRTTYPELDKQGIRDEDIAKWLIDNHELDFTEPDLENIENETDVNAFCEGVKLTGYWPNIEN